jgi:hypothetical protein|nr:MAG TPA: Regulatory protein-modification, helix-turn-helix, transcriptional regulato, DNA [Caudoviricetes sp.]
MRNKKNMRKRYNKKVENVDFEKLRKCLKDHEIKKTELAIMCGYEKNYIEKNVLQRHFLNTHVRDILTYAYKIDPSEYMDIQPKEIINAEDDDMYTFGFSFNGKLLKKIAIKSMEEHTTIEDFVFKCIIEGLGDKILEEKK